MAQGVRLSIIVARARNGAIGKDGGLPWRLSDDLKLFKETTGKSPLIMGRNTWESLPKRPLPGRPNIVLTRDWDYAAPGARVYTSLSAALAAARAMASREGQDEVFIIGGESLFKRALDMADVLYVTEVDADVEGDTFFPDFDEREFREAGRTSYEKSERNEYDFTLRILERK